MRMTFRQKLTALVALAAVAMLGLVVASWLLSARVDRYILEIQQRHLPRIGLQGELTSQLERVERALQDAVAARDTDLLEAAREKENALLGEISAAAGALDEGQATALKIAIADYFTRAYGVSRRLIAGETGETIVEDMGAMQQKQKSARELLERTAAFDQDAMAKVFADAAAAQRTAQRVRLAVSLASVAVVILLSAWIRRGVLRSLADLSAGLKRFGEGSFDAFIPVSGRDELGDVAGQANQMAARLQRLLAERNRDDWLKGGLALAQELSGDLDPGQAANRALAFLARYLDAPMGALYWIEHDGVLRRLGQFGLPPEGDAPEFRPGEGLVGEAARRGDVWVVDAPAGEPFRIRSGLVDTPVKSLMFMPLLYSGKVVGVLELAAVKPWPELAEPLLVSLRDTVAIAIVVARSRAATAELLGETQRQAERLQLQREELIRASAFKSQFLANMSHELRTPLNAIIGFAELMHDGMVSPESPEHKEFLGDILTSGRHLLQLINDVLDLSKVEAGKMEFRPEPTDPALLVDEILAILRTTASDKRVRVEAAVSAGLGEVVLDPARLKQVLYNYVSNAIKFTPEGGRVHVRVLAEGEAMFRLEVEDTGIGIAPENLGRLFGEFQQIEEGARREGGTGLGLALTKRLVEAQGGQVGVRSTPGKGSLFYAVLPRRQEPDPERSRPTPVPHAARAGAPAVLVIEDDPGDQRQLVEALGKAGYDVEVAGTGALALARCRERTFAAITLDLLLPDIGGLEVLQQIRAAGRNRDVPTIVITVVGERGALAGFAVDDILPKPMDTDRLLASLARAGVSPGGAGAVLVVDDDASCLKVMAATLRQLGYATRCEPDGASGLRAAQEAAPSAIVLDLCMPGMDGFEFLDRLRSVPSGRNVPVIVWTVKDLSAAELARLRASAQAVVSKGHGGSTAVVSELEGVMQRHVGEA